MYIVLINIPCLYNDDSDLELDNYSHVQYLKYDNLCFCWVNGGHFEFLTKNVCSPMGKVGDFCYVVSDITEDLS